VSPPLFLSVDLGGTKVAAALGTADGTIVAQSSIPTWSHEGPHAVPGRVGALVRELSEQAAAAPVARAILEPLVHCPVALLNDARMATLGELEFGHGRQARGLALAAQVAGGR
jgi:glucokinase